MTQQHAPVAAKDAPARAAPSPFRYVLLFVGLVAVRFLELATSGAYYRVMAYESTAAWIGFSIAAAIICFIVSSSIRKFFPPAITILISAIVGATVTLVASTIPGMVVGVLAGAAATFDICRRMLFTFLAAEFWIGLPAMLLGALSGFVAGRYLIRASTPVGEYRSAVAAMAYIVCVALVWVYFLGRRQRRERGFKPLEDLMAAIAFFVVGCVSFVGGVQLDNQQRIRAANIDHCSYSVVPPGYRSFSSGLWQPSWMALQSLDAKAGSQLQYFSMLRNIHVQPTAEARRDATAGHRNAANEWPAVNFEGLGLMDLKSVIAVSSPGWATCGLGDEGFTALSESTMLGQVRLPFSNISDEGLVALQKMSGLVSLELAASKVTGTGLANLHPAAPLNYVSLAGSPATDVVFQHLSGTGITALNLARTKVTGEGLNGVKLPGLVSLDVAYSKFQEADIPLIPGSVRHLNLNGIAITADGVNAVAQRQSLVSLRLADTRITDDETLKLKNLRIGELTIDATNLTPKACEAIYHCWKIELVVDAKNRDTTEVIEQCRALRAGIVRRRGRDATTAYDEVQVTIQNLTVHPGQLTLLEGLDCEFASPTVMAESGEEPLTDFGRIDTKFDVLAGRRPDTLDLYDIKRICEQAAER